MTYYVPGTEEKDPAKIIMSLQQAHEKTAENEDNIAALQATVAGLPTSAVTSVATSGLATGGPITSTGTVTVAASTQSDQETATSTSTAVTPGRQQFHPSAAKAWVNFTGATGAINASYNIASISRASAGNYTVTFTNAFSSANYVCVGSVEDVSANLILKFGSGGTKSASAVDVYTLSSFTTTADAAKISAVFYGDQ